jgi:transcription antitermination factor NusG
MDSYILQVQTASEDRASKELKKLGLTVTCPMTIKSWRNPKKRSEVKAVSTPVLPGYLVITGNTIEWPEIRATKQVIGVIGFGGRPALIAQHIVDHIANMAGENENPQRTLFKPGQTVEVIEGPWTGYEVKIDKAWSTKARIILDGFGIATVDIAKLEAA